MGLNQDRAKERWKGGDSFEEDVLLVDIQKGVQQALIDTLLLPLYHTGKNELETLDFLLLLTRNSPSPFHSPALPDLPSLFVLTLSVKIPLYPLSPFTSVTQEAQVLPGHSSSPDSKPHMAFWAVRYSFSFWYILYIFPQINFFSQY